MNPSKITTTVGLNIGQIDIHGVRLSFWDLGGQEELQSLWDKVCTGAIENSSHYKSLPLKKLFIRGRRLLFCSEMFEHSFRQIDNSTDSLNCLIIDKKKIQHFNPEEPSWSNIL